MIDKPLPPLTKKQLEVLLESLRRVMCTNNGNGSVTITIQNGHVRYIQEQVSVDLRKYLEDQSIT